MSPSLRPLLLSLLSLTFARPAAAGPRLPPIPSARLVHLRLEANGIGTFLQRLSGHRQLESAPLISAEVYEDVCAAPCETEVDPQNRFRIGGSDVHATELFALKEVDRSVVVKAHVGRLGAFMAGAGLTLFGGLALAGSTTGLVFAVANHGDQTPTTLAAVGVGVGVASLLLGLPLWLTNGTSYSVTPDAEQLSEPLTNR